MLSSVSRELRISLDSCHHVCFSGGDFLCFDFHGKYLFFQHVCHVCSHFNFHGHRRFPQPFGQMIFNVFFWCPNGPGNGLTWYIGICGELYIGPIFVGTCTLFPFTINGGSDTLSLQSVTQEFGIGMDACPYLETLRYIQTHSERCRNACRNAWIHIIRANAQPIEWWGPSAI